MRMKKLTLRETGPFRDATFEFPEHSEGGAEVHLFVGTNGSGKSTILYSIAACLGAGFSAHGQEMVSRRMWSASSRIQAIVEDVEVTLAKKGALKKPYEGEPRPDGPIFYSMDHLDRILSKKMPAVARMYGFRMGGEVGLEHITDYYLPAFAYSGARTLGSQQHHQIVMAPEEAQPLKESLGFGHEGRAEKFGQWLAASFLKKGIALDQGKTEEVNRFMEPIHTIEGAVSRLMGRTVRFSMTLEPLAVVMGEQGTVPIELDLLPDGVKSIISWVGDLMMRLEKVRWPDTAPVTQRAFILLLDEIDIHLHPEWQWRILPLVRQVFPNAQVFASTHSPFVVSSVRGAWIHPIEIAANREATPRRPFQSQGGVSLLSVVRDTFDVGQQFDNESQDQLAEFYRLRDKVLKGEAERSQLESLAERIGVQGEELRLIVMAELAQVARVPGAKS